MENVLRVSRNNDGAAAVEFAIIAPLFMMIVYGMISWGIYLGACHSIQQIAADAARVSVAGLSQQERQVLARDFVGSTSVPLVNERKLDVQVEDDKSRPNQFTVRLTYDANDLPIWNLLTFAMPDHVIVRSATIRIGGA